LLDNPPTQQQLKSLADRLGIDIYYIGNDLRMSTSDDPEIAELAERSSSQKQIRGFYKGKLYVGFTDERGFLFFYGNLLFNIERLRGLILILVITAFLSYFISLFLIRMLLSPLKDLEKGVAALKGGNMNYRIAETKKDELGELAEGFNHMAARIQQMMTDKEQLMLDVSHELKTPITRMKIALEFLEDEAARTSLKEDLDEMEIKVQELLTSARLNTPYGNPEKERINIGGFLSGIVSSYTNQPPGIIFVPEDMGLTMWADPNLLKTACKNIIENALRYSKTGSKPVEISYMKTDAGVEIIFRDYGIGIPENEQGSVFEPFYRVDRSRNRKSGGSGLGFYLVKKIINAHNGRVSLTSTLNEGTTVKISIPENE
jgi:signal transduction histidine kinase